MTKIEKLEAELEKCKKEVEEIMKPEKYYLTEKDRIYTANAFFKYNPKNQEFVFDGIPKNAYCQGYNLQHDKEGYFIMIDINN